MVSDDNHVHIVAVPRAMIPSRGVRQNAQRVRAGSTCGSGASAPVQNRFHSARSRALHLWEAVRYMELNPVRAGMVCAAEAGAGRVRKRLGWGDEWNLVDLIPWRARWTSETWRQALEAASGDSAFAVRLREATQTGRPCGESEFTEMLEAETGRSLKPQKRGPKPKTTVVPCQMSFGIA
jgi:putative transposase